MLDKITLNAPAKINLFLRVLNKRDDGYHNIRSGITFINLYDEVTITKSNVTSIKYLGNFKPFLGLYKDCIISRTLKFLDLKVNLNIYIKKNIPVQAGLGSASTNAATLILGLEKLKIIKLINGYKFYSSLGADIPIFLHGKNSFVQGMGEKITEQLFPKYFFLLVKPEINFSTKQMYNKIGKKIPKANTNNRIKENYITEDDYGNDFEKIVIKENNEIDNLLRFLSNSEGCIFARMTGSGSCCFAAFERIKYANKSQKKLKEDFPKLWSFVGENNTI